MYYVVGFVELMWMIVITKTMIENNRNQFEIMAAING